MARAAELPVSRFGHETRNNRVLFDIRYESLVAVFVSNDVIERFLLPDRSAAIQPPVDPTPGETLPRLEDSGKDVLTKRRDDDVHMVRHDAPRAQGVSLALEMEQRTLDDGGQRLILQEAGIRRRFEVRCLEDL